MGQHMERSGTWRTMQGGEGEEKRKQVVNAVTEAQQFFFLGNLTRYA